MIPVALAKEPASFDTMVRRPGLDAIAELVGEPPSRPRPGPKRRVVASVREDIPGEAFPPLWRDALPEVLTAYGRLCAYLSLYIHGATGRPTVDQVIPKSRRWDRVYEWDNYRLACGDVNARKGALETILDPCLVGDDWFALELIAFQVKPGPGAPDALAGMVDTLDLLNQPEFCRARSEYVEEYLAGEIPLGALDRKAPFIARELRRQGKLLPADARP